jgi:ribonuclease Z
MPSIRLTTLGTGTPRPLPRRSSACNLVVIGNDHLVFDCGRGAVMQLTKKGVAWADITRLFVTHHHFDHIGDIADLMITSWQNGRRSPMQIVGPYATKSIVDIYLDQIYKRDLEFRTTEFAAHGMPEMGTFPRPVATDVEGGVVAEGDGWRVLAFQVEHGHAQFGALFRKQWICLGYRIEAYGKVLAISGDTVPCEGLRQLAQDADFLLQCCWLPSKELDSEYLRAVAKSTLACSDVVGKIAAEAGVKRLVLTHMRAVTKESIEQMVEEVRSDFGGEVEVAEDMGEFEA